MRQSILLIFIFGIALQRTVASLQDSTCSDELKRVTELLESRLTIFGETLNGRLTSFENQITQSECTKNSTIPIRGSETFDYGSRVKSIFDDIIDIYDARKRERDIENGVESLIQLYDSMVKNGTLTRINWENYVQTMIEKYDNGSLPEVPNKKNPIDLIERYKIWRAKENDKENTENSTDGFSTDSTSPNDLFTESTTNKSEWESKTLQEMIKIIMERSNEWNKKENDKENTENSTDGFSTDSTSPNDLFTESTTNKSEWESKTLQEMIKIIMERSNEWNKKSNGN